MTSLFLLLFLFLFQVVISLPLDKEEDLRIVKGEEAKDGELYYQVSVQMQYGNKYTSNRGYHFCGGTLIDDSYVLTAAHCTKTQRANNLKVIDGTTNISDKSSPAYKVLQIVKHEYNDTTKIGDLALLRIDPNTVAGSRSAEKNARPVSLCKPSFQPQGRKCTVSGWGHLKAKGSSVPEHLREVKVMVLHDEACAKMLKRYPWDGETKTMICAGGEDKDACQGDSGGPLVCQDDAGQDCLAGIVSWGIGCATEGIPGVYTNVRHYDRWIKAHVPGATISE